ncbi:MAG TPA: class I SAM-dependent methyltransferase [Anaerolineales bacterium]|jgi:SAM-dependent methyltransferase|nr:class I SAM-dependent methyltransferase [Anaerolineales bacterium]
MSSFDYEGIWNGVWGDMQKYGPVHRHHRRIFLQMFKDISEDEIQSVADIGCGEGSNLAFIKTRFPKAKLHGFDVSQTALESAQKRIVDAKFSILDIQTETPSEVFDLVFCSDVVEHLKNDTAAIQNIRKITGKYALIATIQGRMRRNEMSIGHIRNYNYGELKQKVEEAGFEVLQVIEWGFPLYSPLFRDIIGMFPSSEQYSYGKYNAFKIFISHILYHLFMFNREDKGDVIFILARP